MRCLYVWEETPWRGLGGVGGKFDGIEEEQQLTLDKFIAGEGMCNPCGEGRSVDIGSNIGGEGGPLDRY